jgi:hypothetical protein
MGSAVDAVAAPMRIESLSARDSGPPGTGDAAGDGRGQGDGIGFGAGGGIPPPAGALPGPPTPEPGARQESRARPPRLIYPVRDRAIDDTHLFVARLTIDSDGFVVGAHLLRGVGGSIDDRAAGAVWRFRYSPALGDDGRPVAATVDQPFLLE